MREPKGAATTDITDLGRATGANPSAGGPRQGKLSVARDAVGAAVGAILGLAPHVLHHIGLIAGAAFVTGAGGNALFFVLGLVFSLPLLRRLYRRFHTWRAPAIAAVVFAAVFSLSSFVIGPAISGGPADSPSTPSPSPSQDHAGHHG
jgi:hypothetical protein